MDGGDGFAEGGALCAGCDGVGGVFYVRARDDETGLGEEGGSCGGG